MALMLTFGALLIPLFYFDNHKSSALGPNFISNYIQTEQLAGCYSCMYSIEELESMIGPKPGSSSFCMIQDLSFPWNDLSCLSVNAEVNSSEFPMAWGSFDITVDLILSLPSGSMAATVRVH